MQLFCDIVTFLLGFHCLSKLSKHYFHCSSYMQCFSFSQLIVNSKYLLMPKSCTANNVTLLV